MRAFRLVAVYILCAATALLCTSAAKSSVASLDPQAQQLLQRQNAAKDGVVRLNAQLFSDILNNKGRGYSIVVFLIVEDMMNKGNLQLGTLRNEYGMFAKTFVDTHKGTPKEGKVFLAEMYFSESREVFHRLGVKSLPFIFRMGPGLSAKASGMVDVPDSDKLSPEAYQHYPLRADDFADFVKERTGLGCNHIERPSFTKSPLFPVAVFGFLACVAVVGYRVYYSEFVRNQWLWLFGCLVIYWFATSGGLYNIIRGVPMIAPTKEGRIQWFTQGGGQLGAEGFFSGTMYILFSVGMAVVTQMHSIVPAQYKRLALWGIVTCSGIAAMNVLNFFTFKTGYRWQMYASQFAVAMTTLACCLAVAAMVARMRVKTA